MAAAPPEGIPVASRLSALSLGGSSINSISMPASARIQVGGASSASSISSSTSSANNAEQAYGNPAFGVVIVTQGDQSLFTLFDSVKSYLTAKDELAVLVNGAAHEPAVRAVIAAFDAKEEHKWTISVRVVAVETTVAAVRNQFQNTADFCPNATHLQHMRTEWAYLPGILSEIRRLAKTHPLGDVCLFQDLTPVMDDCGVLLPHTRNWPQWDTTVGIDQTKQAQLFIHEAVKPFPANRIHKYPYMKIGTIAAQPQDWARWGVESATYHTLQVRPLLLRKFGTYDAAKRIWVVHFNPGALGGFNGAMGADPAPGVVKKFIVLAWRSGELVREEYPEGHAGDIHIEFGPL